MPHMITANAIALADALYAAGLAPPGTYLVSWPGGHRYHREAEKDWRPWCDIEAVWHLVASFDVDIIAAALEVYAGGEHESAADWADMPAAIARLALRLSRHDAGG